jgi:ankyrin repeat protein
MRAENEEETDDFPKGTKDYIIKYGIIKTGQIADIQFLLSHGLDVNTLLEKDEENAKQSLLSWAAGCRQREMARILLSKGADPFLFPRNSTDPERAAGASAMGSAIWGNDTKIAEYILGQRPLQQNINLSIKDIDGRQWSLLYLAIYKNSPEMVALLLRHGASAKEALLTDAAGKKWTPLQYASGEEITVWDEDPEAPGIYKQDQLKTERLSFPDPSDEDDEGEQAAKRADQAKNQAIQRLLREHGGR